MTPLSVAAGEVLGLLAGHIDDREADARDDEAKVIIIVASLFQLRDSFSQLCLLF
jgi:hypothetical protein